MPLTKIQVVTGGTIKVRGTFKNTNKSLSDVDTIELVVYYGKSPVDTIPMGAEHKVSTGVYEILYTVPDGESNLVVALEATLEGRNIRGRTEIERVFVNQ